MRAGLIIATLAACVGLSRGAAAGADVNLYLLSRVEAKDALTLADVARVETAGELADTLRALVLPARLSEDGYIDRTELSALVARATEESVFIYGNAVRVYARLPRPEERCAEIPEMVVQAGDGVSVVIYNRTITLEIPGSALQDGRVGDTIQVRVKNNRTLKGKIVDKKLVELSL
ncbi:MAG: hypothetical protein EPN93_06375 [Spirochaetes bacterium]|nr:MAG: hypothetical protein EPN93_06375 [Spirochaetota bacterium]